MRCYFSHELNPISVVPFCQGHFTPCAVKNMELANTALREKFIPNPKARWRQRAAGGPQNARGARHLERAAAHLGCGASCLKREGSQASCMAAQACRMATQACCMASQASCMAAQASYMATRSRCLGGVKRCFTGKWGSGIVCRANGTPSIARLDLASLFHAEQCSALQTIPRQRNGSVLISGARHLCRFNLF